MLRTLALGRSTLYTTHKSFAGFRSLQTTSACLRIGKPSKGPKKGPTAPPNSTFMNKFFPLARQTKLTEKDFEKHLTKRIEKFETLNFVRKRAEGLGIKKDAFKTISNDFKKAVLLGKRPELSASALFGGLGSSDAKEYIDRAIVSSFLTFAKPYLPEEKVDQFNSLMKISDLRFPSEWFPEARQMQRKIILHVGPTNSGKTYRALKRLEGAESGIYCGPLRLLAHEIFEKMNSKGIACNLLTGEEKREVAPYAPLTSSTVEMATLNKKLDVAVIDEIQMIGDPDRGWAWTQALLGLQAKEIHLCGEASAVPLVKRICESLDEEVVVNEYERLTPFAVLDHSLDGSLKSVKKGDCVVAFSRKEIFGYKQTIEKLTGLKCAVAYGGLPPETRALQAKAFNDPESGLDVLVASDAVGMGLNLNIKRIVFSTLRKFNGKGFTYVSVPQLKQIAGRAGRFGTAYKDGEVTTLNEEDLTYLNQCLKSPIEPLPKAGLQPTVDILELFALQMPNEKFSGLLQKFEDLASVNGDYFLCNYDDQKTIAEHIEDIKLPLRDRYQFVTAPVSVRDDSSTDLIKKLARKFSQNEECSLDDIIELPKTNDVNALKTLETNHKKIILYMWLSIRYPDIFNSPPEYASNIKLRCEEMIDEYLKASDQTKRKNISHNKNHKKKYISNI